MCYNCTDITDPGQNTKNTDDILRYIDKLKGSGLGKARCLEYLQKFITEGKEYEPISDDEPYDYEVLADKYRKMAKKWKKRNKGVRAKIEAFFNSVDPNKDEFNRGTHYGLFKVLSLFRGFDNKPTKEDLEAFKTTGGCDSCGTQRCNGTLEYAKACQKFTE